MSRSWKVGDRVSSIATTYPGIGVITSLRFDGIDVRWSDGSWSQERPMDLIFAGNISDPVRYEAEDDISRSLNITQETVPMPFGSGSLESILAPASALADAPVVREYYPNVAIENFRIYQEIDLAAMQPGAAIPLFAKGVIF